MPHPPAQAVTPIAFIHAMLLGYRKHGKDPAAALREAQITPSQLRRPRSRITAAQLEGFARQAMQELDDEALGWFSRRLPWGSYGMLARASLTAPTLGVALARWCRHHGLLTEDIRFSLTTQGATAQLTIDERTGLGAMREFCLLTSLRNVHGVASWLVDSRLPLIEASFPFAAPPHRAVYPLLFPGPVRFGAAQAGFSFDAQYLRLPLRRDERALQAMLQRALQLIVLPYRRDRLLVQRVRELLRERAAELRSALALAEALHLSVRTLHRQLREEGASLQGLKDEVRRDQAMELLRRTRRPVKQIALAVGFDNEKSFSRAFRQWTGQPPSQFRRGSPTL
ncbi:AraC family transcriptional regulator [Ideonella sp. BN130291]|uniref:AraC family transcriptional regulator n=1 Tax=Ideonella sp. BN130291 TaxID=3112940 RepID=UPI002E25DAB2|nr:AraC family transcriptional regulator [Ideonella sp. BN130291]